MRRKTFRPYEPDQQFLLPPDLRSWLPEGDLAFFVSDVVDGLDLSAIYRLYETTHGRGQPPYDPRMMVKLLLFAYCEGVLSSRSIERSTQRDVAFRVIAANEQPDHDTIAHFRRRHLSALEDLFQQVLELCVAAGLVKLGHVALDGTKVRANASKSASMSYERMLTKETKLKAQIRELLKQAEDIDAAENVAFGRGIRGDELPPELAKRESRLKKIQEAKERLEKQAKEAAAKVAEEKLARKAAREAKGSNKGGPIKVPDPEKAVPDPKAQSNFTDPESKMMPDSATKGFAQSYNALAAVDSHSQIVIAAMVAGNTTDKSYLHHLLDIVQENAGAIPEAITADAGFYSEENLKRAEKEGLDLYLPPEKRGSRIRPRKRKESQQEYATKMRAKLQNPVAEAIYKLRQTIIEPVFGQIKAARGIRMFSFRGLARVAAEWSIITMTHNLLKLHRAARARTPSGSGPKNRSKRSSLLPELERLRALSWVPSFLAS